jgi:hypothetical protein
MRAPPLCASRRSRAVNRYALACVAGYNADSSRYEGSWINWKVMEVNVRRDASFVPTCTFVVSPIEPQE